MSPGFITTDRVSKGDANLAIQAIKWDDETPDDYAELFDGHWWSGTDDQLAEVRQAMNRYEKQEAVVGEDKTVYDARLALQYLQRENAPVGLLRWRDVADVDLSDETPALGSDDPDSDVWEAWYPNVGGGGEWGIVTRDTGESVKQFNAIGWRLTKNESLTTSDSEAGDWIATQLRADGAGFHDSDLQGPLTYAVQDGDGGRYIIKVSVEVRDQ